MQAHVKTPHIKIDIEGEIPPSIIKLLKKEYGDNVKFTGDGEYINIRDTEWFKKRKGKMTPGKFMKIYRKNKNWSQAELGKKLGNIPRQHISNMENGSRLISIELAKKLSKIFDVSVERFL